VPHPLESKQPVEGNPSASVTRALLRPGSFALTALLALLTGLGPLSVDMHLPSLPDIVRLLAAPPARVQLTISLYLVGFAFGQIVYGPLSDRRGRKPVLMVALALYSIGSLACAVASSIEVLVVARILQGFGASGAISLARTIVRDLYSGARAGRQLSLMGGITALAPIVAPLIGSTLQVAFGWRGNFVLLLAIGLTATAAVWRLLPETLQSPAAEPVSFVSLARAYRTFAQNRAFVAYLGIISFSFMGLFAWISGSSFVLQDLYGLSAFQYGAAFATASAGYMLGALFAASIVTRIGLDRMIGIGASALAAGGAVMVAAVALDVKSAASLVLPAALYLAGLGMTMPQALAGALTPFPRAAGAASSILGFVQQTSAAALGAVVGHTLGATAWPLATAIAAMGGLALTVWLTTRGIRAREEARSAAVMDEAAAVREANSK
jgi:MFS transporter, DHA1 family, multidrug resistance protein